MLTSQAYTRLLANKKDVEMLWHVYDVIPGAGKAKRHKADVLNRSAIIFITAFWESYIEDIAAEAFDVLLESATDHSIFPEKVRAVASKHLLENRDERKIWDLAGEGWIAVLNSHKNKILSSWMQNFNTPKSTQIEDLFLNLLGIRDITSGWSQDELSSKDSREKLDKFIVIRGNIAHRVSHSETVHKTWGKDYLSHILMLAKKTDESVIAHLSDLIGREKLERDYFQGNPDI